MAELTPQEKEKEINDIFNRISPKNNQSIGSTILEDKSKNSRFGNYEELKNRQYIYEAGFSNGSNKIISNFFWAIFIASMASLLLAKELKNTVFVVWILLVSFLTYIFSQN